MPLKGVGSVGIGKCSSATNAIFPLPSCGFVKIHYLESISISTSISIAILQVRSNLLPKNELVLVLVLVSAILQERSAILQVHSNWYLLVKVYAIPLVHWNQFILCITKLGLWQNYVWQTITWQNYAILHVRWNSSCMENCLVVFPCSNLSIFSLWLSHCNPESLIWRTIQIVSQFSFCN